MCKKQLKPFPDIIIMPFVITEVKIMKNKNTKIINLHKNKKMHRQNLSRVLPEEQVAEMFQKKFTFQQPADEIWHLPTTKELYQEYYRCEELQELKKRLNQVKSQLNEYELEEWSKHTRRQDPAGNIPQQLKAQTNAELVTVAWCKFYEILNTYDIVPNSKLNSLHLCEAPGAFIAALNHYLHTLYTTEQIVWNWRATTLNPYHEENPPHCMISDDRLILHTLKHWLFHADFTGNLLSAENVEHMQQSCATQFTNGVHLITADGSVDCMEVPDIQEEHVSQLNFAEIVSALSILAENGSFVIKLFTLFEAATICKMYLLACAFTQLHVYKPVTSRRGNSEVYVICLGYKPHTENLSEILALLRTHVTHTPPMPLFARAQLPEAFLKQIKQCAQYFMQLQIDAIETNIYAYRRPANQYVQQVRAAVCAEYFKRYQLKSIERECKLLSKLEQAANSKQGQRISVFQRGSYAQRKQMAMLPIDQQIFQYRHILNELEKLWQHTEFTRFAAEDLHAHAVLKITRGLPVQQLRSSMFVATDIIVLSEKLENIFEQHCTYWRLPNTHCELLVKGKFVKINLDVDNLNDLGQAIQSWFQYLVQQIFTEEAEQVSFHNLPFVTHFSVSLLYWLAQKIYSEIEFDAQDCNDFKITLIGGKNFAHLKELEQLLQDNNAQHSLLCLLQIPLLHDNPLHFAIKQLNNAILLRNCQLLLDI